MALCSRCGAPSPWPSTSASPSASASASAFTEAVPPAGDAFQPVCQCFVPCPLRCKAPAITIRSKVTGLAGSSVSSSSSSSLGGASSFSFDVLEASAVLLPNDPAVIERHLRDDCVEAIKAQNQLLRQKNQRVAEQLQRMQEELMRPVESEIQGQLIGDGRGRRADSMAQTSPVVAPSTAPVFPGLDAAGLTFLQVASASLLAASSATAHTSPNSPTSLPSALARQLSGSDDLLAYEKSSQRLGGSGWAFGVCENAIPALVHAQIEVSPQVRNVLNVMGGVQNDFGAVPSFNSLASSPAHAGVHATVPALNAESAQAASDGAGDWSFGSLK